MTRPEKRALTDPAMLAKIDKLFSVNVGHHIDLPQIVMLGDQSSGKSSTLEGLTRLPFPRDSGLCTRFATQITFRRASASSIFVSIIPGKDADDDHVEATRAFKKTGLTELDEATFSDIMREVQIVMGIDGVKKKTFSSDVLSIEVTGPDQDHLTVIDVPGIFQRTQRHITTKADKDFVKRMILDYMKNPRSVMLTVVPASQDPATQLILELAEEVDPLGQRTLGVLTKVDLVDRGAEKSAISMVEGRAHELRLGWCIVRNPGQQEMSQPDFDRYEAEDTFFSTVEPWNSLPKDRVGIGALRERLQMILAAHIRHEFPTVKAEVSQKLNEVTNALTAMGPSRDSVQDKRRFLIEMAMHFQNVVTQGLDAKYRDDCFYKLHSLRIATLVVNRSETFTNDFAEFGHSYQFAEPQSKPSVSKPFTQMVPHGYSQASPSESLFGGVKSRQSLFPPPSVPASKPILQADPNGGGKNTKSTPPPRPENCSTRKQECTDQSILDLLHGPSTLSRPLNKGILEWIGQIFGDARGFELGSYDPSLLASTFKYQSMRWENLVLGYLSDIVVITQRFIMDCLEMVCREDTIRARLSSTLLDKLLPLYVRAFTHAEFLLEVERSALPATMNHYLNDNLAKARQERLKAGVSGKTIQGEDNRPVVRLDDLIVTDNMSNKDHTVQDLHDILRSYYKVARKNLVDNVYKQAALYHLITGPNTPLRLFSPTWVSYLSDEQLEEIAGEDSLSKRKRQQLTKEMEDLEKGRRILSS
ncbi:dynamin GTPase [Macrophomina phaseolina]|uniref:Dynamin GTPase n=1 Tax=Macrophomina phaseolina TaxID=35725 RepID=A0ABQ8GAH5_9PEZI|nr:dynamin GTPase [Macrophomina phaseolina]